MNNARPTDTLRRDDMQLATVKPAKINKQRKPRKLYQARIDGFPGDSRAGSRRHSRKLAQRAVRLLKSWGVDAYLA